MLDIVFPFAGGLGLFLLGMMLLSEGLIAFAGGSLQKVLLAFTGHPIKAFISGVLITALAQSSTATTVTLIGFVSAGLITFTQAIGVVIGASLGNTGTGWIVSTLGLRVNLGFYTLPLMGLGALMMLLTKGQVREIGRALAGFGMLFLGLSMLQDGMQGLSGTFSLARMPTGGYGAYVVIVLIGLALTAVLQSSTAAIAMTLTALETGAISFDQAAAVVIGASIGTTLTGVLVSIGGTIYAKRTAIAYILFNVAAGLMALLLLPLFLRALDTVSTFLQYEPGAVALAAFHSLFIAIGAIVFLPLTERFARLVVRLVPDRHTQARHHLDISLLSLPTVALETSQRTLETTTRRLMTLYEQILEEAAPESTQEILGQAEVLLNEAYEFVSRIQLSPDDQRLHEQRSAQLHTIDHLLRLLKRLQSVQSSDISFGSVIYQEAVAHTKAMLAMVQQGLASPTQGEWADQASAQASQLSALAQQFRQGLLAGMPVEQDAQHSLRTTDTFRWLERTGHHIGRVSHYLALSHTDEAEK